ncbi:hypothetical protein C8P63_11188 [Melghirimyces profundicolus]|uniref:Uncharacterized protein n=1 Tax=Melghirimyces profundicolus TaxID=1242148 RepID=A0A2T6BUB4_9BACL|nr:hypothetical protein [Melghirimyces profundicolus]PTX59653.1 hypothetical protein C8P63_11188 [Melghirimyces profundicolus]
MKKSSIWAGVLAGGVSQWQDTRLYMKGEMDSTRYTSKTVGNVTGATGLVFGVEYGALLGTLLLPGIGTTLGMMAGGMIGDRLGHWIGETATESFNRSDTATGNHRLSKRRFHHEQQPFLSEEWLLRR